MTVLWIDVIAELGGAQRSMLEICAGLKEFGIEVVAAAPHGPLFDQLTAAGLTVYPVSPLRASKRGWGLFTSTAKLLRAPATVHQIIRAVKPDIVHANSLTAFLAAGHISSKTPAFWHVRDLRLPVVLARDAARHATRIVAVSSSVDEYLVDILSPRLLGRIRVIRNGIDTNRFKPGDKAAARLAHGLPPQGPVIGMIANLIPWKRHDAFIQAAARIRQQRPDASFVVVGRDLFNEHRRWVAQLEKSVSDSGLDACFRWIRDLDSTETLLPALDALLHPALHEPFGRVVCEAMAAGVPVVAADSAGPASVIRDGVSGLLVRDGDPEGLAAAALALLADPARAARISAAGLHLVAEQFTSRHVCRALADEYRATLAAETQRRGDADE